MDVFFLQRGLTIDISYLKILRMWQKRPMPTPVVFLLLNIHHFQWHRGSFIVNHYMYARGKMFHNFTSLSC